MPITEGYSLCECAGCGKSQYLKPTDDEYSDYVNRERITANGNSSKTTFCKDCNNKLLLISRISIFRTSCLD